VTLKEVCEATKLPEEECRRQVMSLTVPQPEERGTNPLFEQGLCGFLAFWHSSLCVGSAWSDGKSKTANTREPSCLFLFVLLFFVPFPTEVSRHKVLMHDGTGKDLSIDAKLQVNSSFTSEKIKVHSKPQEKSRNGYGSPKTGYKLTHK